MAIYNRYFGNTGHVQRIPEPPQRQPQPDTRPSREKSSAPPTSPSRAQPPQSPFRPPMKKQPVGAACGGRPGGLLGSLTSRLDLSRLETEDLILLLILYLLYRESGDEELLIMMGAMLLL